MHVRVVRFTDVDPERIAAIQSRIDEEGGPPPGVNATGLKILVDESQQTALVLQYFATAADMEEGARVFAAMDPADTPGTRASVDMCEVRIELDA
jgi:hypothetical protein